MRLFLNNKMAPGDTLMLTAAVRDLRKSHPEIQVNVKTSAMEFWENNPYLDRSVTEDNADKAVYADYPLYKDNNRLPYHFIHGFRMFLEDVLGIRIEQGDFKVDVHLTDKEKDPDYVKGLLGFDFEEESYWLVNAGHKTDFTAKQWVAGRWNNVVNDALADMPIGRFVQIGSRTSIQPKLDNVVNLVGKTSFRQLCSIMYWASGVLTGVSMPMHLATMDAPGGGKRPCVVVAGGREPSTWEAYPTHQFIHNCGCYPCNRQGGCWRSRVKRLNDGTRFDASICEWPYTMPDGTVVARCMEHIDTGSVLSAMRSYFKKDW